MREINLWVSVLKIIVSLIFIGKIKWFFKVLVSFNIEVLMYVIIIWFIEIDNYWFVVKYFIMNFCNMYI